MHASRGNIAVSDLLDFQRHQLVLLANVEQWRQQRSLLMQEKTRRDATLVGSQQKVKSFENLREFQQSEAQRLEAARLQTRLDEWTTTRLASPQGDDR